MRFLKKALRTVFYLLLLALVLAGGALVYFTQTEGGRASLAGIASGLASGTGREVRISGLNGILGGHLTASEIVVADEAGTWLAVNNAAIEWSPHALLGFSFDADRISAERIEVPRRPVPVETEEGGGFNLPVTIDVKAIELPDIRIGASVAGSAAQLAATGSVKVDNAPLNASAELSLKRTDGPEGSLHAEVAFVPDENRLDLEIKSSEPEGGVLATLLRLPGTPPVGIEVSGSGPLSDWQARGMFLVSGAPAAEVKLRHQLTDQGSRITTNGNGAFAPFLPDGLAPIAQGSTSFVFNGLVRPWDAFTVEELTLRSETIAVDARGSLDPEGVSDFQFTASATGDAVPLAFGAGEAQTQLAFQAMAGRAFGPGDALGFNIAGNLSRFAASGIAAEDIAIEASSDSFDLKTLSGPVALNAQSAAVGSTIPTVANLLAGAVSLTADGVISDGSEAAFERLSARSGTLQAEASGRYGVADNSFALKLSGSVLAAVLPSPAGRFLDKMVTVTGTVERDAEGRISLADSEVRSGALAVAGSAAIDGETVAAELEGTFADLSKLAEAAAGEARFSLAASGELGKPEITANVASDRMTVAGRELTGLSLDAAAIADPDAPSGDITLAGRIGDDRLDGKATLSTSGGRSEIGDLRLDLGDNKLFGTLTLDSAFVPEGSIQFDFPDIGPLAALALVDVTGEAAGAIRFSRDGDAPRVMIEGNLPRLVMDAISADGVFVSASADNYLEAPVLSGRLTATGLSTDSADIRDAQLSLVSRGIWTEFEGSATANGTPASTSGRVKFEDGTVTAEIADADAQYRGMRTALEAPTVIVVRDGTAFFDGLVVSAAGGTATISGSAGDALDVRASIAGLPASAANGFAPSLGAGGTISGTVRIGGTPADPQVAYDLVWSDGRTAQTLAAGLGAMKITSKGTYTNDLLSFDADVGEGSGLTMNGGGAVDVVARSLDAAFAGRVPFAMLASRLAAQGISLNGGADVNLKVGGGFGAPQVNGTVRSSGARLVHAATGLAVEDLAATIDVGDGRATIRALDGRLSTGGSIVGSGYVGIDPAQGFPADLNLKVDNGRYTDGRVVTANFDGAMALQGSLTGNPLLSGEINLGRSVITIPESLPTSLSQLDVQHRNASTAVEQQQAALNPSTGEGGSGAVSLDLTIRAAQSVIVQGRGLDAVLTGSVRVTGPSNAVRAVGQFELQRGRLEILGRRLDFTSGLLTFSGSLVPYLDFVASTVAEDATVTVRVTGSANNPSFSFESSPSLPEDEILARLLFGKAMSNLSAVQVAQLASAAAQLAGIGGSTTLLQRLRERVGVDDIDVRTDEETGDTSVSVGKYLNDRTYLSIEKGSQPGSGKAVIDLNIGGIKLRGEASDSGETGGGIFYEREY
ncbi:translocation/assembly module TamB domain-containing protein [Mesorhizobium sp. Z1-4]|uniref:translocation/assembly module TamB domain-containing protein n=1 Tax=Mesorhizobium sp. Z1-4 TaxID=2448478 RepID=UPI000FDBCC86|nr:translocation/assembly module TamB domain-containing protein [Mesorhizobium sp. Z1-4]